MNQKNSIIPEEGKLRWHHGLGTAIAGVLIVSLVIGYVLPSYLPFSSAATTTKTWSADADFNNNDVTSEGATTIVQATTTGAGAVRLNLVGTSSVSEAFSDETNFNTGSSSAIISGGSLKIGSSSWTQTDWTAGSGSTSTATGFSTSTNIATSSGAFTASGGDGTLTSNIFNTKFSDGGATWGTASWTTGATPTTTVKIRTSNNSDMSGATAFSSCNSITSGADISSNNCVTDGNKYVQYQVTLSVGTESTWDASTASYSSVSSTSVGAGTEGFAFSSDGTKMYTMSDTNDTVYQYDLLSAWDVSTASATVSFSVTSQETTPTDVTFSSDGTKMYMVGYANDKVHQYALSSAWDVSTASYSSVSSSVASQDDFPMGISFSSDGTKMYMLENNVAVYQYSLSSAWDVSTASYASITTSTTPGGFPGGLTFSSDGTKMYVTDYNLDAVYQYSLGTAWNVSTASYSSVSSSVASQDGNPMDVEFSSDGTKMYMMGRVNSKAYQYSISTTTTAATFSDITLNFTPASGVYRGESNTLDSLGTNIRFAKLGATSTPGTGSISYYLSNDAGTNWSTTTANTILTFSTTTGSALRWRVDVTGDATVEDVSVDYNGYYATGTIRNLKIDANGDATWNTISWNVTAPAGTEAKFRTRGTNTAEGEGALSSATWSSYYATSSNNATITSSSANPIFRWLEVELFLNTGTGATDVNGGNTPSAEDFTLTYVVNGPPQFDSTYGTQGQTVEQLATSSESGWGQVRIIYSVRDTDTASGTYPLQSTSTSFDYRLTSGDSWTAITNATLNSGATSSKTMSETVYSTVTRNVSATSTNAQWDAKTQLGQVYSTTVQIRVTVNDGDGANNTSSSISAAFTIDTANPTSTTFTLDSSSSSDAVNINFTDNTNIQYRFSSTSIATSSDAVSWTSAGTTSKTASATVSDGLGGNASSGEVVYFQVRDSFGNYTTGTATAPGITGDNQTRITLKDISNPTIGTYKEFVSWRAYVATTSATFSAYDVYRSTTTNTAYTLLTSITDSATNYYTDSSAANGTTYYYKVRFRDTDGDVSAFSAEATDKVDGQGGTDIVAPTITSITTSTVQTTWATMTWTTDELASSAVRVGTSAGSYNTTSSLSNVYKTSHSETITGLASGTTYYFQVRSTDSSGNETADSNSGNDYIFTTLAGPTITGVAVKSVADATATIRWSTDVAATSAIRYSTNSSLTSPTSITSSSKISGERELDVSGLTGATLYYFEVRSTASSSGVETIEKNSGNYFSFRTTNDTTPPTISNIDVPVKITTSAVVTWDTNEPATSQVEWGITSGSYPSSTTKSSTLTKSHAQTITQLAQATTYYFRVKSQDGNPSSAETVSSEQSFVSPTPETVTVTNTVTVTTVSAGGGSRTTPADTTPPIIRYVETAKVNAFDALVTFVTNEPTVSFVDFGETKEYGKIAANKVFQETHAVKLTPLRMGTTYNYRVKAVDKGGNDVFSENFSFKTPFLAEQVEGLIAVDDLSNIQSEIENVIETIIPSVVPPFVEEPKVASTTETEATITWKTNIPAYSMVSFAEESAYNPTSLNPYVREASQTNSKVTDHALVLTGLSPNIRYHFQVKSFSIPKAVGRSDDLTFITKASKIIPQAAGVKKNAMTISWQTDEPASSIVEHTNTRTGVSQRVIDEKQVTAHSILLENLDADTIYQIRVYGVNTKGNTLESGEVLAVRTGRDIISPAITGLKIESALFPGRTDLVQTAISWTTDEPATSIVEFQEGATRTGDTLEQKESVGDVFTTRHSIVLTKLRPGGIYQIRVVSKDEAGNEGSSPVRMIVTPRQSESIFDVVIRNFEDSFQFVRKLR